MFAFARAVAERLVRAEPKAFTLEYGTRGRESKILLDDKRNHRAAVAVAAYSARARANAAISAPVAWRELGASLPADALTLTNIEGRAQAALGAGSVAGLLVFDPAPASGPCRASALNGAVRSGVSAAFPLQVLVR